MRTPHRDSVCGMEGHPEFKTDIQGCLYLFCSQECKIKFDANPALYLSDSSLGS